MDGQGNLKYRGNHEPSPTIVTVCVATTKNRYVPADPTKPVTNGFKGRFELLV